MEESEWTQVNCRKKGGLEASQQEAIKSTSFFFTNFPEDWSLARLRKEFEGLGNLVDFYVARKKSRAGKCFGFLRYAEVCNPASFERLLNGIPVGSFKVKVNIAKFNRNKTSLENASHLGIFHPGRRVSLFKRKRSRRKSTKPVLGKVLLMF